MEQQEQEKINLLIKRLRGLSQEMGFTNKDWVIAAVDAYQNPYKPGDVRGVAFEGPAEILGVSRDGEFVQVKVLASGRSTVVHWTAILKK